MEKEFLKTLHDYQNIIYKVCRLYRNGKEDQEDLFQEIVYQLWKAYPSFKGEAKISSWLYRIALNTAMAFYRKATLKVEHRERLPERPASEELPSEREEQLFAALWQLNDVEKAVLSLFLEAYSYQEIAAITGLSETNVGVRLNRIKKKLKQILN